MGIQQVLVLTLTLIPIFGFILISIFLMAAAISFNLHNSRWLSLLWLFTGSGKTYADFRFAVLGGFNNMIRNFLGAGCFFMYLMTKNRRYLTFVLILHLSFVSSAEGPHGVFSSFTGIYLLIERKKLKYLSGWAYSLLDYLGYLLF